jgi:CBS domain-containing protein
MPLRVAEIMNGELFSVGREDEVDMVLRAILLLGINGVPVLDEDGKPLGLVSVRDLVADKPGTTVGERMTQPPATVTADARIAAAARILAGTRYHRLVVVDSAGRAVGMVSSVDMVRGLLGLPATHPASFPHVDRETGLSWTDEMTLDADHIQSAPEGPGVLMLYQGGPEVPERAVCAEAPPDIRRRLTELLEDRPERLSASFERGGIRFRAASVPEAAERAEALAAARRQVAAEAAAPADAYRPVAP